MIEFSKRVIDIINKLDDSEDYVAYELMDMIDPKSQYRNVLNIDTLDVSKYDYSFEVSIDGKIQHLKIGVFLRSYYPNIFTDKEISEFAQAFVDTYKGRKPKVSGKPVPHEKFKYDPTNVRSTFLSLVTKTYPHGHEDEVLQFLPKLESDKFGNYFKIIPGDDTTMFTSHLDTADRKQADTTLLSIEDNGDEIIYTDNSTILGADDKAGVTVMLYMMHHRIPGIYYFFLGEERGGIGSNALASEYDAFDSLKNVKRCVSFDRRKTGSIITSQLGRQCCSDEFADALCSEYNKSGLSLSPDSGGIYTDSASFLDDIAECTNVSVGYDNEHTGKELQNITFLENLCKASLNVKWSELPTTRKVGLNPEVLKKHRGLINAIRESRYYFTLDVRVVGLDGRVFIKIDLDASDIKNIHSTLVKVEKIMYKFNVSPLSEFEDTYIKIELT